MVTQFEPWRAEQWETLHKRRQTGQRNSVYFEVEEKCQTPFSCFCILHRNGDQSRMKTIAKRMLRQSFDNAVKITAPRLLQLWPLNLKTVTEGLKRFSFLFVILLQSSTGSWKSEHALRTTCQTFLCLPRTSHPHRTATDRERPWTAPTETRTCCLLDHRSADESLSQPLCLATVISQSLTVAFLKPIQAFSLIIPLSFCFCWSPPKV